MGTVEVLSDGKECLEAFHDMLHVLYVLAQFRPELLCRSVPEKLLYVLVDVSRGQDKPALYAGEVVKALRQDPKCEAMILPIVRQAEEGIGPDPEDALKNNLYPRLTPAMYQLD